MFLQSLREASLTSGAGTAPAHRAPAYRSLFLNVSWGPTAGAAQDGRTPMADYNTREEGGGVDWRLVHATMPNGRRIEQVLGTQVVLGIHARRMKARAFIQAFISCECVCACVRACVRACMHAWRVRASACVRERQRECLCACLCLVCAWS